MKRNKIIYHLDLLATNVEPATVWLWALNGGGIKHHGSNIVELLHTCKAIASNKTKHTTKEFHFYNLEYCGSFLLDFLLNLGYKAIDVEGKAYPKAFEFRYISIQRLVYSFVVNYDGCVLVFRSSNKYLSGTLDKWADSHNIEIKPLPSLETKPTTLKQEWVDEIYKRTEIARLSQITAYSLGLTKNTAASNALAFWKQLNAGKWQAWTCFDKRDYRECIDAYRGGVTKTNKRYEYVELHNIQGYDVISMYGGEMYERNLPFGRCKEYAGETFARGKDRFIDGGLSIIFFTRFKCKIKEGCNSFVALNGEYLDEYDTPCTLSSVDYQILRDSFDIEIEQCERVYFWAPECTTNAMFKSYIDHWFNIKNASTGAIRLLAKIMLNALYGKFGTKPHHIYAIPYLDDGGVVNYQLKGVTTEGFYMPIAIFIASYARKKLYKTIKACGNENWIYCDTDSIYTRTPLDPQICGNSLGMWKLEHYITRAFFTLPKRYKYEFIDSDNNTVIEVVFAGMPKQHFIGMGWDEIILKNYNLKKRVYTSAQGGKILQEVTISI